MLSARQGEQRGLQGDYQVAGGLSREMSTRRPFENVLLLRVIGNYKKIMLAISIIYRGKFL